MTTNLNESRKLLKTYGEPSGKMAKVYKDSEWNDHIVKYYDKGVHQKEADSHHYEDKEDAHNTAKLYVGTQKESTEMTSLNSIFESIVIKKLESTPVKDHIEESQLEEMTMGSTKSPSGKKVEWISHPGIGHSVTVDGEAVHHGFLDSKSAASLYAKHSKNA